MLAKYELAQRLVGRKADFIRTGGLRSRANFAIWWDGERAGVGTPHLAMFENGARVIDPAMDFIEPAIADFASKLLSALKDAQNLETDVLSKLFEVRFYLTSEQLICVLLYHRKIGDLDIFSLRDSLQPLTPLRLEMLALAHKERLATCESFVHKSAFGEYEFNELCFIQPSLAMNEKMLAFAISCVNENADSRINVLEQGLQDGLESQQNPANLKDAFLDLLELYCGYGNFSIALAPYFKRVFATELAKNNVKFLRQNLERNGVKNLFTARLSDAEVVEYLNQVREFNRCKNLPNDWQFSTVLIDPPRSGAASCLGLISRFEKIIYISCNPLTLADDLNILKKTHKIVRFEIFDQFVNSEHLECGVLLIKERK